jgi:phosphoglycolate phosphatase-like HAD superfamily hydrolase
MYKACLFDIDGTLVDSNDAHAHAWVEAFAEAGINVDFERVRRSIGMGGDKLMPAVSRLTEDTPEGKRVANLRGEIFASKYLPRLQPFPQSPELVSAIKSAGLTTVAASSAKRDELHGLLRVAGASELLDHATSSDDAEESKPDPDILHAALQRAKAAAGEALMIGDTPYDVEAARRAGVDVLAFRCGGWGDADLRGALALYDGPWDLLAQLDRSPLRIPRGRL